MGMKEPMHEPHGTVKNAGTVAKKVDPNAEVKNAGTRRGRSLNQQGNIKNSGTPNPKKG